LTVVLIGNSDGLAALGAVEHAAVDGDDVGRVAVDVAAGTSITALSVVGSLTRVSLGDVSLLKRGTDYHGGSGSENSEDGSEGNHFEVLELNLEEVIEMWKTQRYYVK